MILRLSNTFLTFELVEFLVDKFRELSVQKSEHWRIINIGSIIDCNQVHWYITLAPWLFSSSHSYKY